MARTYLVFGDIEGKLDVLRVECTKCGRGGHYGVAKVIEKYGRKGNMMKWRGMLNARFSEARTGRPNLLSEQRFSGRNNILLRVRHAIP